MCGLKVMTQGEDGIKGREMIKLDQGEELLSSTLRQGKRRRFKGLGVFCSFGENGVWVDSCAREAGEQQEAVAVVQSRR